MDDFGMIEVQINSSHISLQMNLDGNLQHLAPPDHCLLITKLPLRSFTGIASEDGRQF